MNTTKTMLARAGAAGGSPRPGFTLIELLIAVGALAFVAVGIAAIFEATGRTITAGKRVSAFGSYASLIEQQMRADFEAMTRDGFLVIRNEMADADGNNAIDPVTDRVPLVEGDIRPRPRRIDELMFFAKGQFVTAREALHPDVNARSDAARIYYGHGKRLMPPTGFSAADPYYTPGLDDPNNAPNTALGFQNGSGNPNPNRFASDWILLRHLTLLCPPETSRRPLRPSTLFSNPNAPALLDSDTQIALQPAASNIFRALIAIYPLTAPGTVIRTEANRPFFAGGLLDIATTSLQEIRSIVMTADTWPGPPSGGYSGSAAGNDFFDPASNAGADGNNEGVDGTYRQAGTGSSQDEALLARSQAWMSDALPTLSTAGNTLQRIRLRCEPTPPNYVGSVMDAAGPWNAGLTSAIRRADQLMLSSSNFLPRCTEFIVEWSFGHTFPADPAANGYDPARVGELVWYGMPRRVNGRIVASPYVPSGTSVWEIPEVQPFRRIDGSINTSYSASADLIHGDGYDPSSPPFDPLASYFGYVDPRFNPDANNDGKLESPQDSASPTLAWPWPKLIRVTLSLADPADPSVEQTFQFTFETPPPPAN